MACGLVADVDVVIVDPNHGLGSLLELSAKDLCERNGGNTDLSLLAALNLVNSMNFEFSLIED